jgi:hypothetical protein
MTTSVEETTPDQLLESFRGNSMKSIIVFTVIVHLVVLIGTSIPYFLQSSAKKSAATLGEKERLELAAGEATKALREIAQKHGLNPQDLSARIAGGATPAAPAPAPAAADKVETPPTPAATTAPEAPASEIEGKLQEKKSGPELPPVEEEENLFE